MCGASSWKPCGGFPSCAEDIYLQQVWLSYLSEVNPVVGRPQCQSAGHRRGKALPCTWRGQTHSTAKQNKIFDVLYLKVWLVIRFGCFGWGFHTSHSYCPTSAFVALMTVRHKIPLRASFRIQYLCWSVNSLPSFDHLPNPKINVFSTHTLNKSHFNNCGSLAYELPYLIRGKGVESVEQVNCTSSPSIRQALSNRHTNLGGAGEKERK